MTIKTWYVERTDGKQEEVRAERLEITDYGIACFDIASKLVVVYNQHTWNTIVEGD